MTEWWEALSSLDGHSGNFNPFAIFPIGAGRGNLAQVDFGVEVGGKGIGNIHGVYPSNWKGLSFETLDKIQQKTGDMPLVLHGGTGIPDEMVKKAITLGVSKVNVNTECQLSFAEATRKYIEAGKDLEGKGFDPRKLLAPGAEAIKATVIEKMNLHIRNIFTYGKYNCTINNFSESQ